MGFYGDSRTLTVLEAQTDTMDGFKKIDDSYIDSRKTTAGTGFFIRFLTEFLTAKIFIFFLILTRDIRTAWLCIMARTVAITRPAVEYSRLEHYSLSSTWRHQIRPWFCCLFLSKKSIKCNSHFHLRRETIREDFGNFRNDLSERVLCACKKHRCRLTDVFATNIIIFENNEKSAGAISYIKYKVRDAEGATGLERAFLIRLWAAHTGGALSKAVAHSAS